MRLSAFTVALVTARLACSGTLANEWDIDKDWARLGIADAQWTIDEVFPGTKLIFDGRYTFKRKSEEPTDLEPRAVDHYIALSDLHLQIGKGETDLEYAIMALTPWTTQKTSLREPARGKWQRDRDQIEWGTVRFSFDDPLGIDSYTELVIARAGRSWAYKRKEESPWSLMLGLKVSLGWAWAESIVPEYGEVSNAILGSWLNLAWDHEEYGRLYTRDRVVPGFTLGRPDQHSTSREARVRFGYFNQAWRGLTVDVYIEKRSFNFADAELPDLYTNSRRIGLEMGWGRGK